MRCQGHIHIQGPEGGEVLVECDAEAHPETDQHSGWMRVSWQKGHTHPNEPSQSPEPIQLRPELTNQRYYP